jgi:hypothetical protein
MATPEREEIAKRHGFANFAELLDLSDLLTQLPGDKSRSYIARAKNGLWFIWEDILSPPSGDPGDAQ